MLEALLPPTEAAQVLGIPLSGLYRLTRMGRIPVVNLGGRYRYDQDTLREWILSGGVPKTQDKPTPKTPVPELRAVARPRRNRRQGA